MKWFCFNCCVTVEKAINNFYFKSSCYLHYCLFNYLFSRCTKKCKPNVIDCDGWKHANPWTEVRESPKLLKSLLKGIWMSLPNIMEIQPLHFKTWNHNINLTVALLKMSEFTKVNRIHHLGTMNLKFSARSWDITKYVNGENGVAGGTTLQRDDL